MQSEFPFGFGPGKATDLREEFWAKFEMVWKHHQKDRLTFREFCEAYGFNHRTAEGWLYRRSSPPPFVMRLFLEDRL